MRIGSSAVRTLFDFDRNFINTGPGALNGDSLAVGPHSATTRGSYTVPSNRKMRIGLIALYGRRASAAGTLGLVDQQVQIFGNTAMFNRWKNNVVDAISLFNVGTILYRGLGETVSNVDSDAGTTGTVDYGYAVEFITFDS